MVFGWMSKREADALKEQLAEAQARIKELEALIPVKSEPKQNKSYRVRTAEECIKYVGQPYDPAVTQYEWEHGEMTVRVRKPYSRRGTGNYIVAISRPVMRNIRSRICSFEFLVSIKGNCVTCYTKKRNVPENCMEFYNEAREYARKIVICKYKNGRKECD